MNRHGPVGRLRICPKRSKLATKVLSNGKKCRKYTCSNTFASGKGSSRETPRFFWVYFDERPVGHLEEVAESPKVSETSKNDWTGKLCFENKRCYPTKHMLTTHVSHWQSRCAHVQTQKCPPHRRNCTVGPLGLRYLPTRTSRATLGALFTCSP